MREDAAKPGFQIFRAADAVGLMEAACMSFAPVTPVQEDGMNRMVAAGALEGEVVKVLVNIPGFSLAHAWFKPDYPLPLHSHDTDCLYYIIAGSLRLGTNDLGARDCFFVPADVPYTYRPGADGVELLEFRHANSFNFVNLAKGETFWNRATEVCEANREAWLTSVPPR